MGRIAVRHVLDSVAWAIGIFGAVAFRYDFQLDQIHVDPLVAVWLLAALLQAVIGRLGHAYGTRHRIGTLAEVNSIFWVTLTTGLVVGAVVVLVGQSVMVPRSSILIAFPIAFVIMGGVRYLDRRFTELATRPPEGSARVLVYGAGYLGSTLVRRMLTDPSANLMPVGLIDDAPERRNTWVDGVRVLGTGADLEAVTRRTGATELVVAIARADAILLRQISDGARLAGLNVKVLPPLEEILSGKSRLRDLRDVSIEDLVGRRPIDTQFELVAGYVEGKRVLVTGAGGSIGSELCRQLFQFSPAELIMLDHDETGLQATQISLTGQGLLDGDDVVLASIRDAATIREVFEQRRPEVVFHAAALKHLPVLERYPEEAWQTNVVGTLNVLEAALAVDVGVFVTISTDKAANPISVLGMSKRAAERLTAWAALQSEGRYLSVRFGNVLGSRGSLVPTFASLIDSGGPLTVTHAEATRYFMTIPESCQLVIQAGAIGNPGEVLILDMGEPVRILDIANRMIEMSGRDIAIVFTGLRHGEKVHEELVGSDEVGRRPVHPLISHACVDPLDPGDLELERTWCRPTGSTSRPPTSAR